MTKIAEKFIFWLNCTRAYSLPMSIMAWVIPFTLGVINKGNILYGLLALLGIIAVHLGANLFDDIIDYKKNSINLKKGKCRYFLEEKLTVPTALKAAGLLFAVACFIGLFFISIYKLPIIILMAITGILCLIYPKSGYFGLSEIIIGMVFSPLLFTGVYYVMTSSYSLLLTWLSISFALATVTLLYTDFFLDYESDKIQKKKTLCILSGSKKNAYFLYMFIIFLIYANIFTGIHVHVFTMKYFIIFLSLLYGLKSVKYLQKYMDCEITDEKEFLNAMNSTQKFIAVFTITTIIAML